MACNLVTNFEVALITKLWQCSVLHCTLRVAVPFPPPSPHEKTENQILNYGKFSDRNEHQNRKTDLKNSQNRKTENPNAPLTSKLDEILHVLLSNLMFS